LILGLFAFVPQVTGVFWATALITSKHKPVSKLLGSSDSMMLTAQAADVVVGVWAVLAQGDDVVGHRRGGDDPLGHAVPAQGLGGEAALALLYASAAS